MKPLILKEFLLNPRTTGAVLPSSSKLSKVITSEIGLRTARNIVELGPGTGAITRHIVREIAPEAKFVAVELNPTIYDAFKSKYPDINIINDNAANLRAILAREKNV